MTNLFQKAKTTVNVPAKKSNKKTKQEVQIDGLQSLASIRVLQTALDGIAKTFEGEVHAGMREFFTENGSKKRGRPDNFVGVDGFGRASLELRKRSTRSPLSSEEQDILDEHGIEYGVVVEQEETFAINPEYASDNELLEKVSAALVAAGVPEDFIVHVAPKTKSVATDVTLSQVFQADSSAIEMLMGIAGTLAVKPMLEDATIEDAFNAVKGFFEDE
jgi:hypothetical protein